MTIFMNLCMFQLLNQLEFTQGPHCFISTVSSKLAGPGYEPKLPPRGHVLWLDQTVRVIHRGP